MATADPQYVTRDELAARMADIELRIERRFNDLEQRLNDQFRNQFRWMVGLILPLYGMFVALMFFLYNTKP